MNVVVSVIMICINTVGGGIYLMPTVTDQCKGGLREAFADYGDGEIHHGCYEVIDGDVVVIDDNEEGHIIKFEYFKDYS